MGLGHHNPYDVSYLARWRGEAPQIKDLFASTAQPVRKNMTDAFNAGSQAAAAAPKSAQSQMWDKLQVNKMVCFVMKGDNPANLRTAEVISLADDKRSGEFWFWIDGSGVTAVPTDQTSALYLEPPLSEESMPS